MAALRYTGLLLVGVVVGVVGIAGCGGGEKGTSAVKQSAKDPAEPTDQTTYDLGGEWRAVLISPGGELPFPLHLERDAEGYRATTRNGAEEVEYTSVSLEGGKLVLSLDHYDSKIEATVEKEGNALRGRWIKTVADGEARLAFTAVRSQTPTRRFGAEAFPEAVTVPGPDPSAPPVPDDPEAQVPAALEGAWAAEFREKGGSTFPGRIEFDTPVEGQDPAEVRATVLTDTGDYRYLVGGYEGGHLRLSTFDGGHAFLFHAAWDPEFKGLGGDFWSRDSYHASWRAYHLDEEGDEPDERGGDRLANPWTMTSVRSEDGALRFAFPDLDGKTVSASDPRFAGKVVVVDVFGTWCPNCNDQAPLLQSWHETYGERGLEVVGLAFEMTGDAERDTKFVGKYVARHGLTFPVLVAGTSDKADATRALPDLSPIKAYPTTVFIGRDGKIAKIHTGFAGPATGEAHTALVEELTETLEGLLGAPAPTG